MSNTSPKKLGWKKEMQETRRGKRKKGRNRIFMIQEGAQV
jgi:hypothetical protein